jgi:exopolysaccharide biosynthesis polyprenyl glycosylphosphotransferase
MSTIDRAVVAEGLPLDEHLSTLDEQTRAILERRRTAAIVRRRGWLVRRMLLAADLIGLVTALFLTEYVVGGRRGLANQRIEDLLFLATLPGWIVVAKLYGLYDHDEERTDHSTADDFGGVAHMVTICAWLFWAASYITGFAHPTPAKLLVFWATAVSCISLGRAAARAVSRRRFAYLQNAIVVGAGDVGQSLARKILRHPEYGINVVGFVDAKPKERPPDIAHLALLGGPERISELVQTLDVERVIFAFSGESHENTLEWIRAVKDVDVQIDIVPRFFEIVGPGVGFHTIEGLPLAGLPPLRLSSSSLLLKRSVDLLFASAALLLFAPVLVLAAIAIKLDSRGPVFFRQLRMGHGNRPFWIWKLRTMDPDADERKAAFAHLNQHAQNGGDSRMFKIRDDPRVTRVGRWLRRYSLDELPQLINVLTGEMSLVGPRPLIPEEHEHVKAWATKRLDLKPGLTGLWQVLGRSDIPFEEMVQLDYRYVTGWSLLGDIKIALRTLPALVRQRNAC